MDSNLREARDFHGRLESAIRTGADAGWCEDLCLCVPRLIELMESSHDRPMSESREAIRSLASDYCMRGDLGEMHNGGGVMLDAHVKLLIDELEKCRRLRIQGGDWSDLPCPPQMFG